MKRKIDEITQVLATEIMPDVGILTGIGGQILTCSELFLQKKISQEWLVQLHQILEDRITTGENIRPTYCTGFSGVGWLYEYLSQRKLIDYDTNILLEEFDSYLEKTLQKYMIEKYYDFLHGGVGVAFYFSKRAAKKKELITVLNRFLEDLEKMSTPQEDGAIKWISSLGDRDSKWGYNISLSHGMSSIIAVLSKIYEIDGVNKEKTRMLLRGAVQYILAQEIDKDKYGSYFSNFALESTPIIFKSRLAWCYGDLGIASALFQAGKALKEENWVTKAVEVLLFAATQRRNLQENSVTDAILCHGAAGIGHIFYRAWWNTKLPEFKDAADYWFEQTLKMATFKDGFAGYKILDVQDGKAVWINRANILEGISGIGLALLTYYYQIEPTWDECLLLS